MNEIHEFWKGRSRSMKHAKTTKKVLNKSLALILAMTMMLSVFALSAVSVSVSAATVSDQQISVNFSQDALWKTLATAKFRFVKDDGTVLSTKSVSVSGGSAIATAPAEATKVEISNNGFNYSSVTKAVADGYRRIFLKATNIPKKDGGTFNASAPYIYAFNGSGSQPSWDTQYKMTSIDGTLYYCDIPADFKSVIFDDNKSAESQTTDLNINTSYSTAYSIYNVVSGDWSTGITMLDLSGADAYATDYYMHDDHSFVMSKYVASLSDQTQNKRLTYKNIYVYNTSWSSYDKVYVTYDYNDDFKTTVALTSEMYNNTKVFKGKIPVGASVRFMPNSSSTVGASSMTTYPTSGSYGDEGDTTATFRISSTSQTWCMLKDAGDGKYDSYVPENFSKGAKEAGIDIVGVDATYVDYWSNNERNNGGYLSTLDDRNASSNLYGWWFQFDDFNRYVSDIAKQKATSWSNPLYFGNIFKGDKHYNEVKKRYVTNSDPSFNLKNFVLDDNTGYAINNSNGMVWAGGNMYQSLQGLVGLKLDSKGNLLTPSGDLMPYFDTDVLQSAKYSDKKVASVFKSSFPFRATTDKAGVTTYSFNSKNATDNVYFTWDQEKPTMINYGAGTSYGVKDKCSKFGGSSDGYGIFPFNNTSNTSSGKKTIGKNSDGTEALDYGFGVRLDINFKVPANGKLVDGSDVSFNFTGDDDLWVYIGEDSKGADAELVLDLGGDHKEANGSINFNTMKAYVSDSFHNYGSSDYKDSYKPAGSGSVPSDEFWVPTGEYTDFCAYTWGNGNKYVSPRKTENGYYKFNISDFSGSTGLVFCKWKNVSDGKLSSKDITNISGMCGKIVDVNGNPTTSSALERSFNGGKQLDPNKIYHMVVFYMERGESESNFSVSYTMTPANNDLTVNKTLNTGNAISSIANDLKENELYDYKITSNKPSGTDFILNGKSATLDDGQFTMGDGGNAEFVNTFETNSKINIDETYQNTELAYTTNNIVYSGTDGKIIAENDSANANFNLVDPVNPSANAVIGVDYVNSIKTAPLVITKAVVDEKEKEYTGDSPLFHFTLLLDLDGPGSKYDYKAYPLYYTTNGTTLSLTNDGEFVIAKGQTITIQDIPVGATYKLTEKPVTGYMPYKYSINGGTAKSFDGTNSLVGKVEDLTTSNNSVDVTNKIVPSTFKIQVNKKLDDQTYTGNDFKFTIKGFAPMDTSYEAPDNKTQSSTSTNSSVTKATDGAYVFPDSALSLINEGYYRYIITEDFNPDAQLTDEQKDAYVMDKMVYLVEVHKTAAEQTAKYWQIDKTEVDITDVEAIKTCFNTLDPLSDGTMPTFENKTQHAKITIKKSTQTSDSSTVDGTKFALIKVSDNGTLTEAQINKIIKDGKNMNIGETHEGGKDTPSTVVFDKLCIYADGTQVYDIANSSWYTGQDYRKGNLTTQRYAVFEYSPATGYSRNKSVNYVSFPTSGQYDITMDYVDGAIVMPAASGEGMRIFFVVGLAVLATGAMLAGAYVIYKNRMKTKRKASVRK